MFLYICDGRWGQQNTVIVWLIDEMGLMSHATINGSLDLYWKHIVLLCLTKDDKHLIWPPEQSPFINVNEAMENTSHFIIDHDNISWFILFYQAIDQMFLTLHTHSAIRMRTFVFKLSQVDQEWPLFYHVITTGPHSCSNLDWDWRRLAASLRCKHDTVINKGPWLNCTLSVLSYLFLWNFEAMIEVNICKAY